jgi:glucose/arabinose dehydrogenase
MLRLNVTTTATAPYYTIPPDNPYIGNASVLDEIWAMGLRNPWRWSFDRANNDMWIADVGEGSLEEVNYRAAGTTGGINYGWRCYEGNQAYNTSGCQPAGSYNHANFHLWA